MSAARNIPIPAGYTHPGLMYYIYARSILITDAERRDGAPPSMRKKTEVRGGAAHDLQIDEFTWIMRSRARLTVNMIWRGDSALYCQSNAVLDVPLRWENKEFLFWRSWRTL